MKNSILVQVLQTDDYARSKEFYSYCDWLRTCLFFAEFAVTTNVVAEIATCE